MTTFSCPFCGLASHNPNDSAARYCGRCHVFVDDALADGVWTWIVRRYTDGTEAANIAQVMDDCGRKYLGQSLQLGYGIRLVTVAAGHDFTGRKMRESDLVTKLLRVVEENAPRHREFGR